MTEQEAMRLIANRIEEIAFSAPAPNVLTPQFVMLANAIRDAAREVNAQDIVIPEGWKLVPIEPTHDMLMAGYRMELKYAERAEMYRAMLAEAPTIPKDKK